MLAAHFQRAREYYLEGRIAAAGLAVLRKAAGPAVAYGTLIFFRCRLRDVPRLPSGPTRIRVREAGLGDLRLLEQLDDAPRRVAQARHRLATGDRWLIGIDEGTGRLATWRWVTQHGYIPELDRHIAVPASDVYIYDLFTAPAFRRQGVDSIARPAMYGLLRDEGVRALHAYIDAANHASLRAARHLLRRTGSITYLTVRGHRPVVLGAPALQQRAGIRLSLAGRHPVTVRVDTSSPPPLRHRAS
jgi:hypothetical protein